MSYSRHARLIRSRWSRVFVSVCARARVCPRVRARTLREQEGLERSFAAERAEASARIMEVLRRRRNLVCRCFFFRRCWQPARVRQIYVRHDQAGSGDDALPRVSLLGR